MTDDPIPFSDASLRRSGRQRTAHKIGLAGAALVLFLAVCHRLLQTPLWSFNGARLMPSLALGRGINFYVLLPPDRKSTRLNSSHRCISYAVFCFSSMSLTPTLSRPSSGCIFRPLCYGGRSYT